MAQREKQRNSSTVVAQPSCPDLIRASIFLRRMDRRVIGERSDAVLRTAMPGDDTTI
jgi:hypothetical protein